LQIEDKPAEYSCAMLNRRPWTTHRQRHYTKPPPSQPKQSPQTIEHLMSMVNHQSNSWLGDSGASCHFTNIAQLSNSHTIHEMIQTGDGRKPITIKQGELTLEVRQQKGTKV
jgi:hypothetical protein